MQFKILKSFYYIARLKTNIFFKITIVKNLISYSNSKNCYTANFYLKSNFTLNLQIPLIKFSGPIECFTKKLVTKL